MSAMLRKSLQEMVSVYWGDGDGINPPPTCIQNAMSALATADKNELLQVAKAAIAYIDAIPKDIGDALPAMPGFDRDWAEEVISEAKKTPLLVGYGYSAEIQSSQRDRFTVSRLKSDPFDTPLYTSLPRT